MIFCFISLFFSSCSSPLHHLSIIIIATLIRYVRFIKNTQTHRLTTRKAQTHTHLAIRLCLNSTHSYIHQIKSYNLTLTPQICAHSLHFSLREHKHQCKFNNILALLLMLTLGLGLLFTSNCILSVVFFY